MAKSNTNNAILYAGYIYIGRSTSDNTIYVSTDLGRYVTSYTYYKSTFYDEIGNQARQNHVDMSYYIDFDKNYVEYTAETEQLQYDAETYEEIKQNSEETNETQENGNIEQENQETNTIQSQVEENNENIINENVVNENVIVNSQNTNITLNNA